MTPPPPPKCGSVGGVRMISQAAFDDLVRENVEDLGMDPAEALQDAIDTLTLQGVDLSGIVICTPGEGGVKDNPVMRCLEKLKRLRYELNNQVDDSDELMECFEELSSLCSLEGTGNAAIATRNGAVELVCSFYSQIQVGVYRTLNASLKALAPLLHDMESRELFKDCHGPMTIVGILDVSENLETLAAGFSIVAMAATANEILKELFMELKIDELIIRVLTRPGKHCIQSVYDAIHVLLAADDNRVVASQVYGYARRFAKVGIAVALVDSLHEGISSPGLVSACTALKAVAVNDEICKNIAENGGIDALLHCIDDSGAQGNKVAARVSCSLLSKLAGSDMNKNAVVEKKGMDGLIKLSSRFCDDPSILQEVMSIISVLCLRSPDNAARAIEAGAGDLAFQAMKKFPNAQQMQRCSCLMIRNLVVRNPENRTMFLGNGIDKFIRKARQNHECCKDAATDALRDLGLDDYNS